MENNENLTEIRCVKCKRLLLKQIKLIREAEASGIATMVIEVKCPKCSYIGSYELSSIPKFKKGDRIDLVVTVN